MKRTAVFILGMLMLLCFFAGPLAGACDGQGSRILVAADFCCSCMHSSSNCSINNCQNCSHRVCTCCEKIYNSRRYCVHCSSYRVESMSALTPEAEKAEVKMSREELASFSGRYDKLDIQMDKDRKGKLDLDDPSSPGYQKAFYNVGSIASFVYISTHAALNDPTRTLLGYTAPVLLARLNTLIAISTEAGGSGSRAAMSYRAAYAQIASHTISQGTLQALLSGMSAAGGEFDNKYGFASRWFHDLGVASNFIYAGADRKIPAFVIFGKKVCENLYNTMPSGIPSQVRDILRTLCMEGANGELASASGRMARYMDSLN